MTHPLWQYVAWALAAGLLGFGISALFSGWLRLPRRWFLIPYVLLSGGFVYGFYRWSQIDLSALVLENWAWGLLAGIVVGALLVRNVLSQPASARSTGAALLVDIGWLGLGYGAMDALLLNVMPVVAVWQGLSGSGWTDAWPGKLGAGALALVASLLVTLLYHLGYREFRNRRVALVLIGNTLITLAYLASANPLGALVSHMTMHVAAVFRGPETMVQLPPHAAAPGQSLA
jgi:hypothetical protein